MKNINLFMEACAKAFSMPIGLFNYILYAVGIIWLGIEGSWKLIFFGITLFFISHFFISMLLTPAILLADIALKLYNNKKRLFGHFFTYFQNIYTVVIMAATCIFSFIMCLGYFGQYNNVDINNVQESIKWIKIIPYYLYSWNIAFTPWIIFAAVDNEATLKFIIRASIYYSLFLIFFGTPLQIVIIPICIIMELIVMPIKNLKRI